ncbi:MAG: hypothetical protein ACI9P8_000165, partial [Bacteroidia bacterium]
GFIIFNSDMFLSGDSIVEGVTYKKFIAILDIAPNSPSLEALIREDVGLEKVYIYSQGEEKLLYDFDMTVGQTVTVQGSLCEAELTVASVEMVMIDGIERERYNFEGGVQEYWIEGIGSELSPLNPGFYECNMSDVDPWLRCFYDGAALHFQNPNVVEDCPDLITSVAQIDEKILVVFPNPAKETLNIVTTNGHVRQIELINSLGQVEINKSVSLTLQSQIDISHLSAGMYQLRMTWADGATRVKVLVKE